MTLTAPRKTTRVARQTPGEAQAHGRGRRSSFDIGAHLALPRVEHVAASPRGEHPVVSISELSRDRKRYITSLYELDPSGRSLARRLTQSATGEGAHAVLDDGSILFIGSRPSGEPDADADVPTALWRLPLRGEAAKIAAIPGGFDALAVSQDGLVAIAAGSVFPGAATPQEDERKAKRRKDAGVEAMLLESYPIRRWDHFLGPRDRHLFRITLSGRFARPVDLTPDAGSALVESSFDVAPDGAFLATDWAHPAGAGKILADVAVIDLATGTRRLVTASDAYYRQPRITRDGRTVICVRSEFGRPAGPGRQSLWAIDLDAGAGRSLSPEFDDIPNGAQLAQDGRTVYFLADRDGHTAVFATTLDAPGVHLLEGGGSWTSIAPVQTGLIGVRSAIDRPPQAVHLDVSGLELRKLRTRSELERVVLPGRLERVETAANGRTIKSWLLLPRGRGPFPLVLWSHGGPIGSWTGWAWRWNPQLLAARGYAVLMPDFAFSTGYGHDWIAQGWAQWGGRPYDDLMETLADVARRPDIDADRLGFMGGSYGGYMANWAAGHTDQFKAIVTHASVWDLRSFHGTTDLGTEWEEEMGDPYRDPEPYRQWSPNAHVARIRTPMLVIHGERDYRVAISEALSLWTDLSRHGVDAKFLYYPDENHWVLKPQNARLWYEVVLAFLDHHLLGKPWRRPELL